MNQLFLDARSVLDSWRAPDARQEELRVEYLAHLERHPDAMSRSCLPGHLTASAALLDADGERTALTLHAKLKMWLQLGGHCEEADSSLAGAALREAVEESGVAGVRLLPVPVRLDRHAVPCGGGSWHLDVQYAAVAPPDAPLVIDSAESDDLRWFPIGELPDSADSACRALVAAAAARVRAETAAPR
ncbi:NUDIX hydrolase [Nocardiopsis ansamitocini]|uniref:NUDIX hydrolase n=1 Tax=Nocardiopsis ansamitocini TaxID=1670832 RepID=A0A9W6P499_9ACTN|nr:NUDIX hydrolase [Nocardiopsis ansamitocini]GLU46748.1 NUDIX hydrolase [Nocardiopsis ansamitocini]